MWRVFLISCLALALTLQLSSEETVHRRAKDPEPAGQGHSEAVQTKNGSNTEGSEGHKSHEKSGGHEVERYAVAHFDWPHVRDPFTIALWILLACIAKIGKI